MTFAELIETCAFPFEGRLDEIFSEDRLPRNNHIQFLCRQSQRAVSTSRCQKRIAAEHFSQPLRCLQNAGVRRIFQNIEHGCGMNL